VFTAVVGLDSKMIVSNRPDFICCVRLPKSEDDSNNHKSILFLFMNNCYAPIILHKYIRMLVVSVFGHIDWDNIGINLFQIYLFSALFFDMLAGVFSEDIGLSQRIALPKDSYLQDYLMI